MNSPFVYPSAGQYTFFRFENLTVFSTGAGGGGGGGSASCAARGADAGASSRHDRRSHSRGALSSRIRMNDAWRSTPSGVNSRNRTSHTYSGSTHVVVFVSGICSL